MAKPSFTPDTLGAAASVSNALATLSALQWAAQAAEDDPGEGLVAAVRLTLATIPTMGRDLECAYRALEGATAGYFDETTEASHARA